MRLCAVTFKKLILYSLAAYTVSLGSYILPYHMRTQRPTRGEAQLITMILSMLYRNNHFREFSVRIMGGKGRKPEFEHQLRSNQYHPSTKKRHA